MSRPKGVQLDDAASEMPLRLASAMRVQLASVGGVELASEASFTSRTSLRDSPGRHTQNLIGGVTGMDAGHNPLCVLRPVRAAVE